MDCWALFTAPRRKVFAEVTPSVGAVSSSRLKLRSSMPSLLACLPCQDNANLFFTSSRIQALDALPVSHFRGLKTRKLLESNQEGKVHSSLLDRKLTLMTHLGIAGTVFLESSFVAAQSHNLD